MEKMFAIYIDTFSDKQQTEKDYLLYALSDIVELFSNTLSFYDIDTTDYADDVIKILEENKIKFLLNDNWNEEDDND